MYPFILCDLCLLFLFFLFSFHLSIVYYTREIETNATLRYSKIVVLIGLVHSLYKFC